MNLTSSMIPFPRLEDCLTGQPVVDLFRG